MIGILTDLDGTLLDAEVCFCQPAGGMREVARDLIRRDGSG